jgi:hypothetical protein
LLWYGLAWKWRVCRVAHGLVNSCAQVRKMLRTFFYNYVLMLAEMLVKFI